MPKSKNGQLRGAGKKKFAIFLCSMIIFASCADSEIVQQTERSEMVEEAELTEGIAQSEAAATLENLFAGEIVQIRVGNVVGNGVLWEKKDGMLIVVTTGHLFEMGSGEARVTFYDGLTASVIDYQTMKPDLAFAVIDASEMTAEQLAKYQAITEEAQESETEAAEQLQTEDEVVLKAYGTGAELKLLEGKVLYPWIYIEDFESHMILAQMDVEQGMSGSGLFDCEGHFLGILCGESEDGEIAVISLPVINAGYEMISENF